MSVNEPTTAPRADDLQGALSLTDFFESCWRHRVPFIIGFLIVFIGAFCYTKFYLTKFYQSQAVFYLYREFTPESVAGVAETEMFKGPLNEQFQTVLRGYVAEEILKSDDLLLEVATRLNDPARGERRVDIYKLLNIDENDAEMRDGLYLKEMRESLIQVRQLNNQVIIHYMVELPDPHAAADFINLSLELLQRQFVDTAFNYFDQVLPVYRQKLDDEYALRERRSAELVKLTYDQYPTALHRREGIEEELSVQGETIAGLRRTISMLELATSPEVRDALRPVQVIKEARAPIKKSRPKTIVSTILAVGIYTFIYLLGLVVLGFLGGLTRGSAVPGGETHAVKT